MRPLVVVRRSAAIVAALTLGVGGALVVASPAAAATYFVINGNDAGAGSLRQAITDANGNPGADTINISYNTAAIMPTSMLPNITDDVTIQGTVANVVLSGFAAGGGSGLTSSVCADVVVNNLTVTSYIGNGINATGCGTLTLNDVSASGNGNYGVVASGIDSAQFIDLTVSNNVSLGMFLWLTAAGDVADIQGLTAVGNSLWISAKPGVITAANVNVSNSNTGIRYEGDGTAGVSALSLQSSSTTNGIVGIDVTVANGATVDLDDFTATGANSNALDLDVASGSSVVVSNSALTANEGRGVTLASNGLGSLVALDAVTIVGNDVGGALQGGGLFAFVDTDSRLEISGSRIADNDGAEGAGLYVRGILGANAFFSLQDSIIDNNDATGAGGGIFFDDIGGAGATGGAEIVRTTISDNSAVANGGGIEAGNWGYNADGAALWIEGSTISGNTSGALGGGIHADNQLTFIDNPVDWVMVNSTVSGNSAAVAGGGIAIATLLQSPPTEAMTLTLAHSTVVDNLAPFNNGGGIRLADYIHAVYDHSVLANNGTEDSLRNGGTTVLTVDHSLIESPDAATLVAMNAGTGNIDGLDPQLGALADNGGTTLTHLPLAGSPLINAGDAAIVGAPPLDQRLADRIVGVIDIGAVEVQPLLAATGIEGGAPLAGAVIAGLIGFLLLFARRRSVASQRQ